MRPQAYRTFLLIISVTAGILGVSAGDEDVMATDGSSAPRASSVAALPLMFEASPERPAAFTARSRGYTVSVTSRDATIALPGGDDVSPASVRITFAEARNARIVPEQPLDVRLNYLKGPRGRWRTGVRTYSRIRLQGIYPGIDGLFYGSDRNLEYDLVVSPGAAPDVIRLRFDGADRIELDHRGDLLITAGGRTLIHHRPVAYQQGDATRASVSAAYELNGREAQIAVGQYDRSRPLVIDPVLAYSTYFGGTDMDAVENAVTDNAGNVYVTGWAQGGDFPIGPQRPHAGGIVTDGTAADAYVAKFAPDGSAAWLTFLGGTNNDQASDIAIGPDGDLFIAGYTASVDFPATAGAYDPVGNNDRSKGGQPGDAFVVRLSPDGTTIRYATYLGGGAFWGGDAASAVAVDAQGRAVIVGETGTEDFPVTIAPSYGSQLPDYYNREAFVARFSADGSRLEWSRLLAGYDYEHASDVALDENGGIYVVGTTSSTDFPVKNAVQPTKYGPNGTEGEYGRDGFLTHLWTDGSMVYSTYLGGPGEDNLTSIARGLYDRIYVGGNTTSDGLDPYHARPGGAGASNTDGVIFQLVPNASSIVAIRYLGGTGDDGIEGLAVDGAFNLWVTGGTSSAAFPVTNTAFQKTAGGGTDLFATKWSPDLAGLHYSTLLGGSADELTGRVAVSSLGDAHVVGASKSSNYPLLNAGQSSIGQASQPYYVEDGVVTKLWCEVHGFPMGNLSADAGAGSAPTYVESGCVLSATSDAGWLHVTGISGTTVNFSVDANTSTSPRSANLVLSARATVAITQDGAAGTPPPSGDLEIVLSPGFANVIQGTWFTQPSQQPAGARDMLQTDAGAAKITAALASPANYFELTFNAVAGRPYRLWVRGRAQNNYWGNDSVHVQFSDSVDASGNAIYRIGTSSATMINLEECTGCGLSGFGWEDNGWGSPGLRGPTIQFASSGAHTIRVQQREDGFLINEIVLSAETYLNQSPGVSKNDTTVLPITNGGTTHEPSGGGESLLYAGELTRHGAWQLAADPGAAGGSRVWHPDAAAAKVTSPLASPQNYLEATFNADAGKPYRVWLRMKADRDYWGNDSVWIQFSGSVDEAGNATSRIGTTGGTTINLEECIGCGLKGWGWQDNGWGSPGLLGPPVYFGASGPQTLRIQTREDGVSIDQIVISTVKYLNTAPGAPKQDATVLPK